MGAIADKSRWRRRRKSRRGFRALQTRDTLFEQSLRRIAGAAVHIDFPLAAEKRFAFLRRLEGVGRCHENRRRQRAEMNGGIVPEMDGVM